MRSLWLSAGFLVFACPPVAAQVDRITQPVDPSHTVNVSYDIPRSATAAADQGRMSPETPVGLVTLYFGCTTSQQADLQQLLADQQKRSSPNFRRWLTPEQFADRFGASVHDTQAVAAWLRAQGFTIDRVGRGRNWVSFRGTALQMETAFHTELHRYSVDSKLRFAPASPPSIPAAPAPAVSGLAGFDDFDMQPLHPAPPDNLPNGFHAMAPGDFATIYDANPLYQAGITGVGQTIAVIAASDIEVSDIHTFRSTFGLPTNDPQVVLYGPDPGFQDLFQFEATMDTEWAGAAAPDASLIVVNSNSVRTSAQYAIDDDLAPVMTFSYGQCEQSPTYSPLLSQSMAQQANAEGITWIAASGDSGAAGCDSHFFSPIAVHGLAISLPSSVPEITAVGGTQFQDKDGTYWSSQNSPTFSSALSYIPEAPWNEAAQFGIVEATTGGASILFSKPAWQSAPGVPQDGARDTPDIAFPASLYDAAPVVISGALQPLDGGGTSLAAPLFAGVLALLNQYVSSNGGSPGLGNVNPGLYRLASHTSGVFHSIYSGNNIVPCEIGTPDCTTGSLGYDATGPGYNLATGLGSIDIYNFVTQWNSESAASNVSITQISAGATSIPLSGSTTVTVMVSGGVSPTGTVTLNAASTWLGTAALAAGSSNVSFTLYGSQLPPGNNTVTAVYSGDTNLNGSAASVSLNVTIPTTNCAIVPSIAPNPVRRQPPDVHGDTFFFTLTLSEAAGVATTLTGFTMDGLGQPVGNYFSTTAIPANGSVSAAIAVTGQAPSIHVYGFSGTDAGGFQWRQEIPVQFLGPLNAIFVDDFANAASADYVAAPGAIFSAYGDDLSASTLAAESVPLPLPCPSPQGRQGRR